MYEVFIEYGVPAIGVLFSGLGAILGWAVRQLVKNRTAREVLARAGAEVRAAVLATAQTYVSKLKSSRADGKLTDLEKKRAFRAAREDFYRRVSDDWLYALARVIGFDKKIGKSMSAGGWVNTRWLDSQIEAEVAALSRDDRRTRAMEAVAAPVEVDEDPTYPPDVN